MAPDVRDVLLQLPRKAIDAALTEHDQLGSDAFLARYGYRPAVRWVLRANEREYEPRAVLAAAYACHTGNLLEPNGGPRRLSPSELRKAFEPYGYGVVDRNPARPPISSLTREAVLRAMEECDRLGREEFLARSGFHRSKGYPMFCEVAGELREYDSKAIVGVAFGYQHESHGPLGPEDFSGGVSTVVPVLQKLGFRIGAPRETQYWVMAGNPNVYRLEDAVQQRDEDVWRVKDKDVRRGDRLLIWQYAGKTGRRGVLALGEVLTDPAEMNDSENPYWIKPPASDEVAAWVRVRYVVPPGLPLWQEDHLELLGALNVVRGSIFKVSPEQWNAVVAAAGGWPTEVGEEEPTSDPEELDRRVKQLRRRGRVPRPAGQERPRRTRGTTTDAFERSPKVKAWVLQEAHGVCELCCEPAPFSKADGEPYLEVHHPVTLAEGGPDTVENAVAVCPNCHRALHHAKDRRALLQKLHGNVARLREQSTNNSPLLCPVIDGIRIVTGR